jgi:hypothetical protein
LETRLQCCSVYSSSCSSLAQLPGLWARERVTTTVESFKKECCGSLSNCRASIDAEWVVIWSSRAYQGGKESNRKWSNRR